MNIKNVLLVVILLIAAGVDYMKHFSGLLFITVFVVTSLVVIVSVNKVKRKNRATVGNKVEDFETYTRAVLANLKSQLSKGEITEEEYKRQLNYLIEEFESEQYKR